MKRIVASLVLTATAMVNLLMLAGTKTSPSPVPIEANPPIPRERESQDNNDLIQPPIEVKAVQIDSEITAAGVSETTEDLTVTLARLHTLCQKALAVQEAILTTKFADNEASKGGEGDGQ